MKIITYYSKNKSPIVIQITRKVENNHLQLFNKLKQKYGKSS